MFFFLRGRGVVAISEKKNSYMVRTTGKKNRARGAIGEKSNKGFRFCHHYFDF